MTPEQLKASILQWAMEGKLVKQDPSDEPASILLEKIKVEKEKLIKEGKIKKSKKLLPVKDDEKPFEIPKGWEWARLENICNYIQRGKSPKYDKFNKIHPVIAQKCNQWSGISLEKAKFLTNDFWKKLENYRFVKVGDILLNSTGLGTVGRVNILSKNMDKVPVDSHVTIIRSNKNIDSNFVLYYMMSPQIQDNLDDYLSGSTKQKEFSRNTVLNLVCPVPPLNEQHRIVAKIEKLMPLVDKYAEAYNRLKAIDDSFDDKLKQSILQYAMEGKLVKQDPNDEPASVLLKKINAEKEKLVKAGKIKKSKKLPPIKDSEKPFKIPASWEWVRLGNVFLHSVGGGTPDKSNSSYWNGSIPWITVKDVHQGSLEINSTIDSVSKSGLKNSTTNLIPKDNLIVVMRMAVGRVAVNKIDACINQDLRALFFTNNYIRDYFKLIYSGLDLETSGMTVQGLKIRTLINAVIPLPPLNEQKRIVTKIDELFRVIKDFNSLKIKIS